MTRHLLAILALIFAAPLAAQTALDPATLDLPPVETEFQSEASGGLVGSVTDDSAWQDLGIAIPAFATNRDVPTPANADGTSALGTEIARIVHNNLRNNGLFRPVGPDALPRP